MNIGIIIYSHTGNTGVVAEKLKEKLAAAGHSAEIEKVQVEGEINPGVRDIQFKSLPDTGKYDALVFGSPVMAFSLNPAMREYLLQVDTLKDKKVACFVTKRLRFHWTGGNRAISKMKAVCEEKGALVAGTGIVVWSGTGREGNITAVTDDLSKLF